MQIVIDRWLSERFGHPLFSLDTDGGVDAEVVIRHGRGRGAVSYQARVSAARPDVGSVLTRAGFTVVNLSLSLGRNLEPLEPPDAPVEVREADPDRDAAVVDIAERAFSKTRFHLDPAIPRKIADRIKRDWAQDSLNGKRGDGMLVAVRDDRAVGFLAGLSSEERGRRTRIIDLIAIDPAAREQGAGRALISRFLEQAQGAYDEVRVGTQAANIAATRFYERLGFAAVAASFELHLHLGDPWPGT